MKRKRDLLHLMVAGPAVAVLMTASFGTAQASALSDLAAQMSPGEWRELTTNNFAGMTLPNNSSNDSNSPMLEFTDKAVRNPFTKKIYVMGCSRSGAPGGAYQCANSEAPDSGYVSYDEATNAWQRVTGSPVNMAAHAYDHFAINPTTGDQFYVESGDVIGHRAWRFSGGAWTQIPYPENTGSTTTLAVEWFPERNVLTVVDGGNGFTPKLWSLPLGGSWSSVNVNEQISRYETFSRYSAVRKLLYFGGGTDNGHVLLTQDQNGAIVRRADSPISMAVGGGGGRQVVDPISGNLLAFETGSGGPGTGAVFEYDPGSNQWTKYAPHPLGTSGGLIAVFVGIPDYGVVFAVNFDAGRDKVYLYKHSAGHGIPVPAPPVALTAR